MRRAGDASRMLIEPLAMDFDSFYRREFPLMVSLARAVCGNFEQAEDLAQEAMARAHRHWHKISGYDKPGAWLRRVTINLAISNRNRRGKELSLLKRSLEQSQTPTVVPDFTEDVLAADAEVWAAVRQLPPKQRAAIALFYQEDLPTKEIADILQCSVSTATSHLSQARSRLAELLARPSTVPAGGTQ